MKLYNIDFGGQVVPFRLKVPCKSTFQIYIKGSEYHNDAGHVSYGRLFDNPEANISGEIQPQFRTKGIWQFNASNEPSTVTYYYRYMDGTKPSGHNLSDYNRTIVIEYVNSGESDVINNVFPDGVEANNDNAWSMFSNASFCDELVQFIREDDETGLPKIYAEGCNVDIGYCESLTIPNAFIVGNGVFRPMKVKLTGEDGSTVERWVFCAINL